MIDRTISPFIRFAALVSPDANGCWNWVGPRDKDGYGIFDRTRAHRFAWAYFNGPIPDGLFVLHQCDNPSCASPHHLKVGTQLDNMREKMSRGRHVTRRGEDAGNAKLSTVQVLEIRKRYANGESQRSLGKTYGTSQGRISLIVNRKSWTHVRD